MFKKVCDIPVLLNQEVCHICEECFEVVNRNGRESAYTRQIRAQLRLSSNWRVTSKTVERQLKEYSDTDIHEPDRQNDDPESWKTESLGRIVLSIEHRKLKRYTCPNCGHGCRVHQYVERELMHVPDMGYDVTLRVRLPKLDCRNCGRKLRLPFPLARPRVSYTKEVEKQVLRLLCTDTMSATGRLAHIGPWVVSDILEYRMEHAVPEQDLSDTTVLFIDETQRRKGHEYMTVFSNKEHEVVYITEGRGMDAIERFRDHLIIQGGDPENVWAVSADMSPVIEGGVERYFPNATLVWDRFHLVQALNVALNEARKRSVRRKKGEKLRHVKYSILKRPDTMTDKDLERLERIRLCNPELALAYDMKESFCEILELDNKTEAEALLDAWIEWAVNEGCEPMAERAEKFAMKKNRILAWFDHRINNGVAEGINSKIQKTKAAAYGYPNLDHFAAMCMYRFGNLVIAF